MGNIKEKNKNKSKIDKNKQIKRDALLENAFNLFTSKGIQKTSISDIVDSAGVAKGTFYLYFKDKYDIRNKLIARKSSEVFKRADAALRQTDITVIEDRIIFMIDNIINQLSQDRITLKFISKNLSWGVFKNVLIKAGEDNDVDFYDIYHSVFADDGRYDNPEVMIFMIIELVGAVCYSAILYNEPVRIEELKPYIFRTVRNIMKSHLTSGI